MAMPPDLICLAILIVVIVLICASLFRSRISGDQTPRQDFGRRRSEIAPAVKAKPEDLALKGGQLLVSGQPVATLADTSLVAGCAFTVGPKPQPCIKVQWLTPAVRVTVGGQPALLQTSPGLCQSAEQIPQGPPTVVAGQVRVQGS